MQELCDILNSESELKGGKKQERGKGYCWRFEQLWGWLGGAQLWYLGSNIHIDVAPLLLDAAGITPKVISKDDNNDAHKETTAKDDNNCEGNQETLDFNSRAFLNEFLPTRQQ